MDIYLSTLLDCRLPAGWSHYLVISLFPRCHCAQCHAYHGSQWHLNCIVLCGYYIPIRLLWALNDMCLWQITDTQQMGIVGQMLPEISESSLFPSGRISQSWADGHLQDVLKESRCYTTSERFFHWQTFTGILCHVQLMCPQRVHSLP